MGLIAGDTAVAAAWIVNSISFSTAIISLNKYITRAFDFDFMTSLTAFHFLVTFLLLEIMCRIGIFERGVNYPTRARWVLAFYGVGSVVFMNFNLAKNSVGFYQLSKLCCIPAIVLYNLIVNHKPTPMNILVSLMILLIGVGLYSVNDVELNFWGSVVAVVAVLLTAMFQLTGGSQQAEYSISGPQLQHGSALPQFVLCFMSCLGIEVFNPSHCVLKHDFSTTELVLICMTAVIAVGVNVSCFGIIGKTSALTYQVVGHAKTILILLIGFLFFPPKEPVPFDRLLKTGIGMLVSMIGIIMYSLFGMRNAANQEEARVPPVFSKNPPDVPTQPEVPLPPDLFTPDDPVVDDQPVAV
jgi:solute carrier family 35 protein E3